MNMEVMTDSRSSTEAPKRISMSTKVDLSIKLGRIAVMTLPKRLWMPPIPFVSAMCVYLSL